MVHPIPVIWTSDIWVFGYMLFWLVPNGMDWILDICTVRNGSISIYQAYLDVVGLGI